MHETSTGFQSELKTKQLDLDSLHASLRNTSTQLVDAKRHYESLVALGKTQSLNRHRFQNLNRGCDEEHKRFVQLEQHHKVRLDDTWKSTLQSVVDGSIPEGAPRPSDHQLRSARNAIKEQQSVTQERINTLKGRSKDVELKYRRVVALCVGVQEDQVDTLVDGLLRAVKSEKGALEVGRVRKFLSGVDGVGH